MHEIERFQSLNDELPACRAFLQNVAEIFALAFHPEDYGYFPLLAHEKVLLDFLGDCPGLPHSHWGEGQALRLEKVKDFITSGEYHAYCAQLPSSGSVIDASVLTQLEAALKLHQLPAWVAELADKLLSSPARHQPFHVFICLKDTDTATLKRMRKLIVHEWSHLLFFSQGIKFQDLPATETLSAEELWLSDEGLATWIEYRFVSGDWNCEEMLTSILQSLNDKGSPPTVTGYFEKGLWFNHYFKRLPRSEWAQKLRGLLRPEGTELGTSLPDLRLP